MAGKYDRKDRFYKKAKSEGRRSRAGFKLEEINKKYKLISRGDKVVDLGAWPGSWLQYILEQIGPEGKAVGIDLEQIEDINDKRLLFLKGDVTDASMIDQARNFLAAPCDVVISDMSPKLSGIAESDQARSTALVRRAFEVAELLLKTGGHFVCKTFKGQESELFVKSLKSKFDKLLRAELESSRKTSNEYYIVGLGIKR